MTARSTALALISTLALTIAGGTLAAPPPGKGGGGGGGGGGKFNSAPLRVTICDTAQVWGDDAVDPAQDELCPGQSTSYVDGVGGVLAHIRANCNVNFWLQDSGTARTLNALYDDPRVPRQFHEMVVDPKLNTHPRVPDAKLVGNMAVGEIGFTQGGLTWIIPDQAAAKKGKPVDNTETYQNAYGRFDDLSFDPTTVFSIERRDEQTWILEGARANLFLSGPSPQTINGVDLVLRFILRCEDSGNCPLPGGAVQCTP